MLQGERPKIVGAEGLCLGCLIAMVLLGLGLYDFHGEYSRKAIAFVLGAAVVLGVAVFLCESAGRRVAGQMEYGKLSAAFCLTAAVALVVEFGLNGGSPPGWDVGEGADWRLFHGIVTVGALASGVAVFGRDGVVKAAMAAAMTAFAGGALWMVWSSPSPQIDVMVVHREGAAALLDGRNPYAERFTPSYSREYAEELYGPELLDEEGRMDAGYTYQPVSLIVATMGHLVGDVRYGHIPALVGTALFIVLIGQWRPWACLAAVIFLYSPRNFYVIEQGWTEPVLAFLFAAFVWAEVDGRPDSVRRKAAPWIFGLLLVSKQYLPLLLPLAFVCLPDVRRLGFLIRAGIAATVVTLPFFLWDPAEFWRATVWLLVAAPFRSDGLSIWSLLHDLGWRMKLPGGLSILVAITPVIAVAFWMRRGVQSPTYRFAAGAALSLLLLFLLGKQAFCNYYFLVIAVIGVAVAAFVRGGQLAGGQIRAIRASQIAQ